MNGIPWNDGRQHNPLLPVVVPVDDPYADAEARWWAIRQEYDFHLAQERSRLETAGPIERAGILARRVHKDAAHEVERQRYSAAHAAWERAEEEEWQRHEAEEAAAAEEEAREIEEGRLRWRAARDAAHARHDRLVEQHNMFAVPGGEVRPFNEDEWGEEQGDFDDGTTDDENSVGLSSNGDESDSDDGPAPMAGNKRRRGGSGGGIKGSGPMPSEAAIQPMAKASYDAKPPARIGQYTLIHETPTLKFYKDDAVNTIVVGVRGTADARDVRSWASVALNRLDRSARWQADKATFRVVQTQYPTSKYDYYAVGHSLGGAISDLALRSGFVKQALSYNAAVQRADADTGNENHKRIYAQSDLLRKLASWFGLTKNTETRDVGKKTALQSHALSNFEASAGAGIHINKWKCGHSRGRSSNGVSRRRAKPLSPPPRPTGPIDLTGDSSDDSNDTAKFPPPPAIHTTPEGDFPIPLRDGFVLIEGVPSKQKRKEFVFLITHPDTERRSTITLFPDYNGVGNMYITAFYNEFPVGYPSSRGIMQDAMEKLVLHVFPRATSWCLDASGTIRGVPTATGQADLERHYHEKYGFHVVPNGTALGTEMSVTGDVLRRKMRSRR